MSLSRYTSEKIKNISFLAILAVFIIHTDCKGTKGTISYFLQDWLHTGCNFAVPLFFIVSGYLFFYNKSQLSKIKLGIRKRVKTLFVPYVIWCTLFIVQIWLASQFKSANNDYFSTLQDGEVLRFLKCVYISPLFAFHLWYVRDLLAVVAISPLVYVCQRKRPIIFMLVVGVLCGLLKLIPWLSWPLTWFSIGSYFALSKKELLVLDNKWIGLALFLGYIAIMALLVTRHIYPTADKWFSFPLFLIGIIGLWNVYDLFGIHKYFHPALTEQTFFLYCAHVPFLTIVSSLLVPIVSGNQMMEIITYPLPAILTCIVLVMLAQMWKRVNARSRISSNIYRYLTGGR